MCSSILKSKRERECTKDVSGANAIMETRRARSQSVSLIIKSELSCIKYFVVNK